MIRRFFTVAAVSAIVGVASFGSAAHAQDATATTVAPEATTTTPAATETTAAAEPAATPAGGVAAGGGFLSGEGDSALLPGLLTLGAIGTASTIYVSRRRRA